MARPGPQTFAKRQREIAKQEKRRAKAEKMAQRRALKKEGLDWAKPEPEAAAAGDGGEAGGGEEGNG